MWVLLAKQAVIPAAAHRRLRRIKCNIHHQWFTGSPNPSTPAKIHGNVQSPALGTSTFALHTALPTAAIPKGDHASKYTNSNLNFSVICIFSLRLSSWNWKKVSFYFKIAFSIAYWIVPLVWCWEERGELSNSSFCYVVLIWNATNWKFLAIESMYINHDLVMMKIGRWTLGRVTFYFKGQTTASFTILINFP